MDISTMMNPITSLEECYQEEALANPIDEAARLRARLLCYAKMVSFLIEELATAHGSLEIFLLAVRNCDPSRAILDIVNLAEEERKGMQARLLAEMLDPEDKETQRNN